MNRDKLNKMELCRHFLLEPAPQVVGELLNEITRIQVGIEKAISGSFISVFLSCLVKFLLLLQISRGNCTCCSSSLRCAAILILRLRTEGNQLLRCRLHFRCNTALVLMLVSS